MKYVIFILGVVLFSSPALARQRMVVEKTTGNVVDVGDITLKYDERRFDQLDYPVTVIPSGANLREYTRDNSVLISASLPGLNKLSLWPSREGTGDVPT